MTSSLPKLSELLGASPSATPSPGVDGFFASLNPRYTDPENPNVVRRSTEFDRIAALPRRTLADEPLVVELVSNRLKTNKGTMALRSIQAYALLEASISQGAFCPIGVGAGKTLLGLLLPTVMGSKRAVYLTNPGLVNQVARDMERFHEHWNINLPGIHIISYSRLSTAIGQGLLESLAPDLIVADEVHALRHATATRTKRVMRYLEANPECRFVAMSGTITSKSIRDYAHLCGRALGLGAPVPLRRTIVDEWARALDSQLGFKEARNQPGALWSFCNPGEEPRDGFKRRLVETPGVVATTDSALGTGLEIRAARPKMELCRALVKGLRGAGSWDDVDLDQLAEARVARQLALGFHYKWAWPGAPDEEWLEARNTWARKVRQFLIYSAKPGLDSPFLVAQAVDQGLDETLSPGLCLALERWRAVQDRPEPPVVPVWHAPDELLLAVSSWMSLDPNGESIVWYEHRAVGELLAGSPELSRPSEGTDPADLKGQNLLLSVAKHKQGFNLQHGWARNLVLTPPSSGAAWEQLIARTHRPGQASDTVTVDVLQHVAPYRSALAQARKDAEYIESTTGQQQKLNLATWVDFEG